MSECRNPALKAICEARASIYAALAHMPPLNHYPDKPAPFDITRSEIVRHIVVLLPEHMPGISPLMRYKEAVRIFRCASKHDKSHDGAIIFDREARRWYGKNWIKNTIAS